MANFPLILATALLAVMSYAPRTVPGLSDSTSSRAFATPPNKAASSTLAFKKRPNIVVVMADDMRVDDLRFAPVVRKVIGKQGLTFDNAFSPYPLCCPARASFLTGRYAHNHRVYWHQRPYAYGAFDDSRTLATSLQRVGYRTAFVGKYLNAYGQMRSKVSGRPSARYVPNGWTDWIATLDGGRGVRGSTYNYFNTSFNRNGTIDNNHQGQYQTEVIADFSTGLIRDYQRSNAPFFLYASFVAPHHGGPLEPGDPRPIRRPDGRIEDFKTPARPNWVKGRFNHLISRPPGMPVNGGPSEADMSDKPALLARSPEISRPEQAAITNLARQRAEAVYVLDRQVARIIATLKRTGEWANTVFMFTSDNGFFLGEHRVRTGKVRAHEPSLRVPFMVTGPGMRSGERRTDPITTVDLTATILDLAGARPPHPADGISRLDTMRHGDRGWTVPVVTEATHMPVGYRRRSGFDRSDARTAIGLRVPRYSLTRYRNGQGELYDLYADPAQMTNRYKDPAYRTIRAALMQMWTRYKDCTAQQCRAPMDQRFQTTAAQTASLTRHYWRGIDRIYGTGASR